MLLSPRSDFYPVKAVILLEKSDFVPLIEAKLSRLDNDQATGLFVGTYQNSKIGFLNAAFSPQIAIKVEQLTKYYGTETLVRIGTCGALQRDIEVGDILAHSGAVRDEGTSKCYVTASFPAVADFKLLRDFSSELSAKVGVTWTTDGRYVETNQKIENFSKYGVQSVEMETSALYVTASLKSAKALSLSVVSDRPIYDLAREEKGRIDKDAYDRLVLPNVDRCIDVACRLLTR